MWEVTAGCESCGMEGPGRGAGGRRGLAGYQDNTSSHTPAHQAPQARRAPEGPEGTGGLRDDAPSEARSADDSRAGCRPRRSTAPLVRRAPEGPEGTGGLRGAAPNEVRTPSLAGGRALRRPEHQRRPAHQRHNTPRRHNKAARPHRGRAAQPVSEAHRRTTTMSGSPRPLSWRTLEIPSLAATSFAVPSMRGSS